MAYSKQTWINLPNQTTPISADRLNHIEDGIYNNAEDIAAIQGETQNFALITESGYSIEFVLNTTNYKLSAKLKDKNNNLISTSNEIDLPIESLVVSVTYDSATKELVFTLQSGETLRVPIGDLISGLVSTSQVKNEASTTAGDVYDVRYINTMIGDIETVLTALDVGSGV